VDKLSKKKFLFPASNHSVEKLYNEQQKAKKLKTYPGFQKSTHVNGILATRNYRTRYIFNFLAYTEKIAFLVRHNN
jgi:hypothetical protein